MYTKKYSFLAGLRGRSPEDDDLLQSFVITLREGMEAALAIAIVLAYLKRSDREDLSRSVYWGLASALVVSAIGAVIFHMLAANTDAYEGYFMVLGAFLVAGMVYWMWRTSKWVKGEIEQKLGSLLGSESAGRSDAAVSEAQTRRGAAGVFLFVFLMVGREGVETILFLSAVSLNTTALLNFAGGVLGLAAAVAFGVLFVRGSIRVNLRQFFSVTTAILFLVAAQLLISGLHELSEARVLPSSTREMAIVGPIVNNDAYFFMAILFLAAFLFLSQRASRPQPGKDQAGRAAWRLQRAEYQRQQWIRLGGSTIALALCLALAVELAHEHALAQPPHAQPIALQGGAVLITETSLRDGKLHFYRVMLEKKPVTFMAIRTQPGEFKTAFDACAICRKTFYYQSGQNVVCSNCGAAIYMPSIGTAGGCNPVPLTSTSEDSYLKISRADLLKEIARF
ncbi:MAG TPA: Fe-S-containing protein [Armatimonadota bacterium]|nr:Fe-S-containing protein [Armatimonadota bacterium]